MMRKTLMIALMMAGALSLQAQNVEFFTPDIVRITHDGASRSVTPSLVVTAHPQKVRVRVTRRDGATVYRSSALVVTVKDGAVTFATPDGRVLTTAGPSAFTPIATGPDQGRYRVRQTFSVDADEGIYGVGLLQNGKMSQRGENRLMMQSNLEDYAHFFQSIKGYGIYWDNYSPTQLVTPETGRQGDVVLESQVGDRADYYFINGGNADGVIRGMRHLSGKVPMLPLWTYGFHQSRERYKSSAELLSVVNRYRKLGIPFDGIIQDWQYWGDNYLWNAMEFLNPDFADAQKMIDEVHRQNAHLSISIWSSFGPMTKPFRQLAEKKHLMSFDTWPESGVTSWPPRKDYPSGVRVYDSYSAEARDIYWDNLSRLHRMGIDAWWMDSTDPDHVNYKDSDLDESTAMGSWRSVRNAYALMAVGGVYDHQRATDSSKRVFILTRSYFAGQQRYGANTWSGDIASSWASLRKQVPICLNYTLTANPNVNTDIGGFFANAYNKTYLDNTACTNPQYQELYVRWMQFGLFCPMMRSHGTEVARELYHFGKEGEPVFDALKGAVEMRYRLLPYIYSTSWQVSRNDDSFMRALMMDFKNDPETWNNNREFMFGRSFLVCPVVDPLYTEEKIVHTDENSGWDRHDAEKGSVWKAVDWSATRQYEVYLPSGADWYDYWTGTLLRGGRWVKAQAPLAHSPLYVKAGSIVPLGPAVQYADTKDWQTLDIMVYPGADARFTLYEDEGDNYNYERGLYSTIDLVWNDKTRTLTIGRRQGQYPGMAARRRFNVKVAGGASRTVDYSGKALTVRP